MKKLLRGILLVVATSLLLACAATNNAKTGKASVASETVAGKSFFYEVHHDGRIHVFDDSKTYLSFLQLGETSYRLTRIGAGPAGETVVFGLTKKDKKKRSGIKSIDMYDGQLKPLAEFYGEMLLHNRFYVFNSWNDMQEVKKIGEAAYRYTQIGAGPKGETVIFVLNKSNKKKKPVDLMAEFKKIHAH